MKTLIAFNTEHEIYDILGWKYTGDRKLDSELHDKLWDAGFNLDDWDCGFACKEPLYTTESYTDEDGENCFYSNWCDDVYWLGMRMENYCCGFHYCEFGGYHWYTVHHA